MAENESLKKVALVTGAGRGIGRGIAAALANRGWDVVINFRSNVPAAAETQALVEAAGQKALLVQADVALPEDRERLLQTAEQVLGPVQLLVNNAGVAPRQRVDLLEMGEASYDEVMAANLKGPFFLTQQMARRMIQHLHQGSISHACLINIGSISSFASSIQRGEYCLSKAGMTMMTQLFAHRLAEEGIGVYEIQPGIIETDMTGPVHEKYDVLIAGGLTPIRRWGQPEDVAQAVVMLAEGYLPYSTGEVLHIDGGFHLRRL